VGKIWGEDPWCVMDPVNTSPDYQGQIPTHIPQQGLHMDMWHICVDNFVFSMFLYVVVFTNISENGLFQQLWWSRFQISCQPHSTGPLEGAATWDGREANATRHSNWKPAQPQASLRHSYHLNLL